MRHTGRTIFILFFALAAFEALTDGRWPRIAFWLAIAALFLVLEWSGRGHHPAAPPRT